ncbi:MAG: metalloregulator ArsR/SmtB family transcription factor [Chthoniobacteraceae bacterium]|nr:metalloregulator ArsR/SmtB family transcription factor [Chthoniobacteraceae bacterium]
MQPRSSKSAARSGELRSPQEYRAGADVFKALGHSSRLLIVDALTRGERCVAELTELIGCDTSTVSNHLAVLRNVGLVADERRGQQVFYRIAAPCVTKVFACLEEVRSAREKQR